MEAVLVEAVDSFLKSKAYLKWSEQYSTYIYEVGAPYNYEGVGDCFLNDAFNSKYSATDYISDIISEYEMDVKDNLIVELLKEYEGSRGAVAFGECEDEVREYMQEQIDCNVSDDYIWGEKVPAHIVVAVDGEANEEFTLNAVVDGELLDGSVRWLIEQQGYTVKEFLDVLDGVECEAQESRFLRSVVSEMENVTTSTNKLTILTRMKISEILAWNEMIGKNIRSAEVLKLQKNIRIGLVDTWNGAGSCIEIALEKELELPIENIYNVKPDGYFRYSVDSVYGPTYSFWSNEEVEVPESVKKEMLEH